MNEMTNPTDAEIADLANKTQSAEPGQAGYILPISFARQVLAKWGNQPQPTQQDKLDAERCPSETQVLAITTAYEQGVGKGQQAFKAGSPIKNPYSSSWNCDKAWEFGYQEGVDQAKNAAIAAIEAIK